MNLLTIDIEEWYLEKTLRGGRAEFMSLYDRTLDKVLQVLDETGHRGTFFCVGQMGRHFPEVLRRIAAAGHEIGCHSNVHTWLDKMTPEECGEDTRIALDELEQCLGKKVVSYRAPAFSVTARNPWVFEILAANGIVNDASIFPSSRDFGGFSGFGSDKPCRVVYKGSEIREFPICPTRIWGRSVVYSGGGYFRFFPESFILRRLDGSEYTMMYFHIADLAEVKHKFLSREAYEEYYKEPGNLLRRLKRYVKSNLTWGDTFGKFSSVVRSHEFGSVLAASQAMEWDNVPVVKLG